VLNVEIDFGCGAVLGYLLAFEISNSATRAHFSPQTVFAASATAFSAAFAKLCCEIPIISMTFCAMIFSNVSYAACRFVSTGSPASCHAIGITDVNGVKSSPASILFFRSATVIRGASAIRNSPLPLDSK
jgi:hypothetical protein